MKEIKDYLHLYLGCNVRFKRQEKKGKINTENLWQLISVHQMTYKKIVTIEAMGCVQSLDPEDIIPILRPLSDMTEEEKKHLLVNCLNEPYMYASGTFSISKSGYLGITQESGYVNFCANVTAFYYLLSKHFDLFGLIESGLAIDKTKLNVEPNDKRSVATEAK